MKSNTLKLGLFSLAFLSFAFVNAQKKLDTQAIPMLKENFSSVESTFKNLDINNNDIVTYDEFKIKQKEDIKTRTDESIKKFFARIDTNSDANITLEEYKIYINKKG